LKDDEMLDRNVAEQVVRRKRERGYFGIGIYHGKNTDNIGTLWRSASILGTDSDPAELQKRIEGSVITEELED